MMDPVTQSSDSLVGQGAIFVLGLQRSGTTWLSNMLVGSGAVAAVAAEEHQGVHESVYFSHFSRAFGPFDDPDARARFETGLAESDYFLLTDLPRAFLTKAVAASRDHAEVFERLMRRVMMDQGCTRWLEKSPHHTLLAEDLAARYPEAQFVCVARRSRSLLASRLAAYGRTPSQGVKRLADLLRGALVNALYTRHLERFVAQSPRAILLHYDDFAADPVTGRGQLVDFLQLGVDPNTLESAYKANSSHKGRAKQTRRLSALDGMMITLGDGAGRVLPLGLLARIEAKRRARRGADWPEWVWRRSGWQP